MRIQRVRPAVFLFVLLSLAAPVWAQRGDDTERASKNGKTVAAIGDTQVTVDYGRPRVRGREVWGALVPYGEVWCPGANEATVVTVTTDVVLEGRELPRGAYTLWVIPGPEEWTVILNRQTGQWHTQYDPGRDLFRFTVEPKRGGEHYEALTFALSEVAPHSATLEMRWEQLVLPLRLTLPGSD